MALQISNTLWGMFKSSRGLISKRLHSHHKRRLRRLEAWKTDLSQDYSPGLLCKLAIMQSDGKSHYLQNVWKLNSLLFLRTQPVTKCRSFVLFFVFCLFSLALMAVGITPFESRSASQFPDLRPGQSCRYSLTCVSLSFLSYNLGIIMPSWWMIVWDSQGSFPLAPAFASRIFFRA